MSCNMPDACGVYRNGGIRLVMTMLLSVQRKGKEGRQTYTERIRAFVKGILCGIILFNFVFAEIGLAPRRNPQQASEGEEEINMNLIFLIYYHNDTVNAIKYAL